MEKTYFINCYKSRDASSIIWDTEKYKLNELTPYITHITCDDGEEFHELINSEWPENHGKNDFTVLELNDFEAISADQYNEYLLCFTALISTDLKKHPKFSKALDKTDYQVVPRISFKFNGIPLADEEGYEEHLFEPGTDNFVDFEEN